VLSKPYGEELHVEEYHIYVHLPSFFSPTFPWSHPLHPPTAANQNGIIRTYNINVTVLESGDNIQLTAGNTELYLEMLHPYYTYSFVISAVTIGPGPPSSVYTITTEEEGNIILLV